MPALDISKLPKYHSPPRWLVIFWWIFKYHCGIYLKYPSKPCYFLYKWRTSTGARIHNWFGEEIGKAGGSKLPFNSVILLYCNKHQGHIQDFYSTFSHVFYSFFLQNPSYFTTSFPGSFVLPPKSEFLRPLPFGWKDERPWEQGCLFWIALGYLRGVGVCPWTSPLEPPLRAMLFSWS